MCVWDGWMASLTPWMWVWVNSGSWWWTRRPGVLWFTGSQRFGHDWATELNWTERSVIFYYYILAQIWVNLKLLISFLWALSYQHPNPATIVTNHCLFCSFLHSVDDSQTLHMFEMIDYLLVYWTVRTSWMYAWVIAIPIFLFLQQILTKNKDLTNMYWRKNIKLSSQIIPVTTYSRERKPGSHFSWVMWDP